MLKFMAASSIRIVFLQNEVTKWPMKTPSRFPRPTATKKARDVDAIPRLPAAIDAPWNPAPAGKTLDTANSSEPEG